MNQVNNKTNHIITSLAPILGNICTLGYNRFSASAALRAHFLCLLMLGVSSLISLDMRLAEAQSSAPPTSQTETSTSKSDPEVSKRPSQSATPRLPLNEEQLFDELRTTLLNKVPGLANQSASFYFLIDASASNGPLYDVYNKFFADLVTHFFVSKDDLCVIPFARHPKTEDGNDLTTIEELRLHDFKKDTAISLLPKTPFSGDPHGTDIDEPLYWALEHIKDKNLIQHKLVVIVRLTDTSSTDLGGSSNKFFSDAKKGNREALNKLKAEFNSDSNGVPRELYKGYNIEGIARPLNFTLWYSDNAENLPLEEVISRTDQYPYSSSFLRAIVDPQKHNITFQWMGDPKEKYELYLSNSLDELEDILSKDEEPLSEENEKNKEPKQTQRIDIPTENVQLIGNQKLQTQLMISDITQDNLLDIKKNILFAIQAAGSRYASPVGFFSIPAIQPDRPIIKFLKNAPTFWAISTVLLLLYYLMSARNYERIITINNRPGNIRPGRQGLRLATATNANSNKKREDDVLLISPPEAYNTLPSLPLGKCLLEPSWLPAKCRTRVLLVTDSGVKAKSANSSLNGVILEDLDNQVQFEVTHDNIRVPIRTRIRLEPRESGHKLFLFIFSVWSLIQVALLIAIAITYFINIK
jgi:hypothetical protein